MRISRENGNRPVLCRDFLPWIDLRVAALHPIGWRTEIMPSDDRVHWDSVKRALNSVVERGSPTFAPEFATFGISAACWRAESRDKMQHRFGPVEFVVASEWPTLTIHLTSGNA